MPLNLYYTYKSNEFIRCLEIICKLSQPMQIYILFHSFTNVYCCIAIIILAIFTLYYCNWIRNYDFFIWCKIRWCTRNVLFSAEHWIVYQETCIRLTGSSFECWNKILVQVTISGNNALNSFYPCLYLNKHSLRKSLNFLVIIVLFLKD